MQHLIIYIALLTDNFFQAIVTWENLFDKPSTSSSSEDKRETCTRGNLRSEFDLLRAGGGPGKLMKLCKGVLEAVPPSSVQAERDFSILKLLLGENRSRMSSQTLDDIFVLRKVYEYTSS